MDAIFGEMLVCRSGNVGCLGQVPGSHIMRNIYYICTAACSGKNAFDGADVCVSCAEVGKERNNVHDGGNGNKITITMVCQLKFQ